jgi:hypothetical protein
VRGTTTDQVISEGLVNDQPSLEDLGIELEELRSQGGTLRSQLPFAVTLNKNEISR